MNLRNKSRLFKSLTFVILISLVTITQSCNEAILDTTFEQDLKTEFKNASVAQNNEFKFLNKKYKTQNGLSQWESQLNKVIENNTLIQQNGLSLIEYKYIRNIDSVEDLEEVKTNLKNNNSPFIVYSDNSQQFVIKEHNRLVADYSQLLDMIMPTTENMLDVTPIKNDCSPLSDGVYIFEKDDIGLVELKWDYKGGKMKTTCLISEKKGIVYD